VLFKEQADDKLCSVDKIAQIGEKCCPDQRGFIKTDKKEEKVGEMHHHCDGAAEIFPEKFGCKGKLSKDLLFKKASCYKNQDKHEGFQSDKKGDPCKVVDAVVRLVEPGDRQAGKKHDELDGGEDSLHFCPD